MYRQNITTIIKQLKKLRPDRVKEYFMDINRPEKDKSIAKIQLPELNGIVLSKIYDKWDAFNFKIVNFPFLDGDVPRSPSYGVYISQLIRFARVCSNIDDLDSRNLFLTAKLLKQG